MFKVLSCDALGISGRQSEIIELALSYRYSGIEIDIPLFCKQVELRGIEHARRFISVLHGIGCRFALDDFGSGIGSFANLKELAIDYLKIDGTYTRNISKDSINHAMVSAIIELSRTLDFRIVAEEVEDRDSFDTVRRLGVDFVQGYIVERPHPLPALH